VTHHAIRATIGVLLLALAAPSAVRAQTPDATDDPAALKLAEPDFTLVGLPTSLRLPTFKSAFRVTHRFTRPLNDGDFGDLAGDLFGIDGGAQIGLEYRFGLVRNGQVGIHRTSNRTIEFFGQYDVVRQGRSPIEISALASIEGTNNFKDSYSPALGAILSRTVGSVAAFYVEPIWINNSNALPSELVNHNDSFVVGLGARVRVRPTVYLVAEGAPRASGDKPGVAHLAFAIEKRAGGHVFQLNFSDALGTTFAQIARGGPVERDWFMGFNISRKFF
jgi:hypothetical protein